MIDLRARILEEILPLVPFDGWSEYSLAQAAKRAGIDASHIKRIFPAGVSDCIDYYFIYIDEMLVANFSDNLLASMRVPDRIETLILKRLEYFTLHREAVRRAIAAGLLPWNAARSMRSLYATVDCMWRLAGDTSIDFSFYTKRMTLAGLYSSTLLYWLNDNSNNYSNTKEFLKRRLSDIATFGKNKAKLKSKMRMV